MQQVKYLSRVLVVGKLGEVDYTDEKLKLVKTCMSYENWSYESATRKHFTVKLNRK